MLKIEDNQIQLIINSLKIEIRTRLNADGSILSLNAFPGHSNRIFKDRLIILETEIII